MLAVAKRLEELGGQTEAVGAEPTVIPEEGGGGQPLQAQAWGGGGTTFSDWCTPIPPFVPSKRPTSQTARGNAPSSRTFCAGHTRCSSEKSPT